MIEMSKRARICCISKFHPSHREHFFSHQLASDMSTKSGFADQRILSPNWRPSHLGTTLTPNSDASFCDAMNERERDMANLHGYYSFLLFATINMQPSQASVIRDA